MHICVNNKKASRMRNATKVLFAVIGCIIAQGSSFSPSRVSRKSFRLHADTQVNVVEFVDDDDRVLDVAAFRNGLVNPEMMVERAQAKRDAIDTTKAALDGFKIGLLYVGPVVAIGTFLESQDPVQAAYNYGEKMKIGDA